MDTGSFTEKRKKAPNPAIDRAPVYGETSLGKPFDNVSVAQAVANVPANCQSDDIIGEAVVRKRAR
jgi:hypothetical protein